MNRSESKYFATAERMDAALLTLLETKDFDFITVKDVCHEAGVNRSTFYLHYETTRDLLEECGGYILRKFSSYFQTADSGDIRQKIESGSLDDLLLMKPDYLLPYLRFVKENRRLYQTCIQQAVPLGQTEFFGKLSRELFGPILARFRFPEEERPLVIGFFINGLTAIVQGWLNGGCAMPEEQVASLMIRCVTAGGNGVYPEEMKERFHAEA